MVCARCGSDAPADARFCPSCGAPLETAPVQEERKLVSVLFVDVVGSTERADGADLDPLRHGGKIGFTVERCENGAAHESSAAECGQDRAGKPLHRYATAIDEAARTAIDRPSRRSTPAGAR